MRRPTRRSSPRSIARPIARPIASAFAFAFALSRAPAVGCGGAPQGSIGVIAQQEPNTGRIIVKEVPAGLAGARAGLEVGDEIIAIDGRPVASMSRYEFRQLARGDVGTHVIVSVMRNGILRKLDVERGALK